jgi:Na+/H+ antiporter NhaD/arsenite permease-like protein
MRPSTPRPCHTVALNPTLQLETLLIFALTFLVLGIGRLPGFRIDRPGAAIIGAGLMLATGALTIDEAWRAVHYETILLLFGMMIVVANLRLSGFFAAAAQWGVRRAHRPIALLAALVFVTGILSALFVNDTLCVVMTPLAVELTRTLRRNPIPYLIGVAVASNAGSVAAITGNPQNMMIASFSKIPFAEFTLHLAPVSLFSLLAAVLLIRLLYAEEFNGAPMEVPVHEVTIDRLLLFKSLAVSAALFAALLAGVSPAKAAMVAGALLLITRRIHPEDVYRQIDFGLLVMFAGLFVVLAGVEKTTLDDQLLALASTLRLDHTASLTAVSAALSNVVSNVPAVLMLKPVIERLADPRHGWLVLAMSSTLAGNLTLLGSVANLIVAEQARPHCELKFWSYTKVGAPLTVLTLAFGAWWLG